MVCPSMPNAPLLITKLEDPGQTLTYRVTLGSKELINATLIVLKIDSTALDDTSYMTINCTVRCCFSDYCTYMKCACVCVCV